MHCPPLPLPPLQWRGWRLAVTLPFVRRMGYNDLGSHHHQCGELGMALRNYLRARDYCTTSKHVMELCLHVLRVGVDMQHWSHLKT